MWYTHTQWNIIYHKNEWYFAICDNMDESEGHYAKGNKSEKDRYHIISHILGL